MKSKIYMSDIVENKDRRFGSNTEYIPVMVDGKPALFTRYAIDTAVERAKRNPEDIPGKTFWEFLITPL